MSMAVKTLTEQLTFTQRQNVELSNAVDRLSSQIAEAYDLLREHEPAFVAAKLGEQMPAATTEPGNRKTRRAAKASSRGTMIPLACNEGASA